MNQGTITRGRVVLLAVAAAVVLLLLPAVALAATPSVTIVGPGYMSPSPTPSPTAAVPAVDDSYVTLYLQDNDWGADYVRFSNDGGATWSSGVSWSTYPTWDLFSYIDDVTLRVDGQHTVIAQFSKDGGTTWEPTASATTLVDQQSPVVAAPEGYWNSHYPYTFTAHDQIGLSGVRRLWYRVDTGALTALANPSPLGTSDPLTASFDLVGTTGTPHTIEYMAQDYAGNYSAYGRNTAVKRVLRGDIGYIIGTSSYVVIDRTRPTVKAKGWDKRWHQDPVTVSFSATDGLAGVDYIQYSITRAKAKKPGAWTTANSVFVSQSGRTLVWYRAVDQALPLGNTSVTHHVLVKITP